MKHQVHTYFDELLLYSGQYALFYVLMNFSKVGFGFFSYSGHVLMLIGLLIQIVFLTHLGDKPLGRIFGSLLCPILYTLFEANDFQSFILNSGHFFFWVFSLLTGLMNAASLKLKGRSKNWIEFAIIFMNVVMFLFIYMYFDMLTKLEEIAVQNGQAITEYAAQVSVMNLWTNMTGFLSDRTHIYLILGGSLLGISLGIGRIRINNLKEKITELFGTYVDPTIRDRLLSSNGVLVEKRPISILFCDIRNFTTLAELNGPTNTIGMLNHYFTLWEQTASRHGGVINKYIGDAVMILFGINDNPELSSEQAVLCALDFNREFERLNQELLQMALPLVEGIGVGIHYGEVSLGNIGGDRRREFTAIGDSVNIASRLESLTKELPYSDLNRLQLLISKPVISSLPLDLQEQFSSNGSVQLKGKDASVEVFQLIN
jgi:class 3 adenylate cyclase